jgi:hypothetical protein
MADSKDDETKFNETLKRMLSSPPTPRKDKAGAAPKPAQRRAGSPKQGKDDGKQPKGRSRRV